MSVAPVLLPDAEALVSRFLRAQSEITTLVSQRVYTAIPSNPTWPLLKLARVSGGPSISRPRHLDAPLIQLDSYGGSKKEARNLLETALAIIAVRLEGTHSLGVVTGVNFGQFSWLPDPDYDPAKPRYVADVTVYLHP